jgi:putative ABC transport system permease protein
MLTFFSSLRVLDWTVLGVLVFFLALMVVLFFLGKVPVSYNVRNLLVRWRITAMTGAIFVLVIALLVVMLAFVNGMYELTKGSAHAGNVVVLSDGATDELFSKLDDKEVETLPLKCPGVLKDEDGHWLASWEVYGSVMQPIPTRTCPVCKHKAEVERVSATDPRLTVKDHGDPHCPGSGTLLDTTGPQRRFIQVRGLVDPVIAGKVHHLELHEGGQWFNSSRQFQCVLGEGLARELGKDYEKPSLEIGDQFDLRNKRWEVTGILRSSGSAFDSEVWCNQQTMEAYFGKVGYTTGVLRTSDQGAAQSLVDDAKDNFKTPAVSPQLETAYYEKLNGTNQLFLWSSLIVVAIMAVGSIFGVMNAMFAAISQRTNDVGVLRILGYKRVHILISFFLESLLLSLVGGALGCAVGYLCNGQSTTSIVGGGGGGGKSVVLQMVVSPLILGIGLGFSLLLGAIGGLLPALSAMRLKPLDSLK